MNENIEGDKDLKTAPDEGVGSQAGCYVRKLECVNTIGTLRKLIEKYDDDIEFSFRNQPMQTLHEVQWPEEKLCLVFQ